MVILIHTVKSATTLSPSDDCIPQQFDANSSILFILGWLSSHPINLSQVYSSDHHVLLWFCLQVLSKYTGCPTNSDFFHYLISQPLFEIASIFKKQMKRRYRPFRILEKNLNKYMISFHTVQLFRRLKIIGFLNFTMISPKWLNQVSWNFQETFDWACMNFPENFILIGSAV